MKRKIENQIKNLNNSHSYYCGWDVGGWDCEKNKRSRDGIVIINNKAEVIGKPRRGNIKDVINNSNTAYDLIKALFAFCNIDNNAMGNTHMFFVIDAPLGYSVEFKSLLKGKFVHDINRHNENSYLFRSTERLLHQKGYTPLSAVKDMIGSQATKAMRFVAKYAPTIARTGVWTDNKHITVIETYPAIVNYPIMDVHKDIEDAYK